MKDKNMKKKAKKEMLSALSSEMKDMMREGYKDSDLMDKMKVTVASDSEEGLEEGLSKAQEIMKKKSLGMSKMMYGEEEDEMYDDEYEKEDMYDEEDEMYGDDYEKGYDPSPKDASNKDYMKKKKYKKSAYKG